MGQAFAVATAFEGVAGLDLQQRWIYAMCPVDERDNGIARLAAWAADHGAGRTVPPLDRASHEELERAEKRYKRLVAWRWLALRCPDAYPEHKEAETLTAWLDGWIEAVLRQQRRGKGTLRG